MPLTQGYLAQRSANGNVAPDPAQRPRTSPSGPALDPNNVVDGQRLGSRHFGVCFNPFAQAMACALLTISMLAHDVGQENADDDSLDSLTRE